MRLLGPVVLTVVLFAALGASSAVSAPSNASSVTRVATRTVTINVRLTQGATVRLPLPVTSVAPVARVTAPVCPALPPPCRITPGRSTSRPVYPQTSRGYLSTTTLHLFASGEQLGFPPNTDLGSMSFTYKPSFCSVPAGATNVHCPIDDLTTVTTLPGGTITAGWTGFQPVTQLSAQCGGRSAQITSFTDGSYHEWFSGLVIPILSGTGTFKGVTGAILIPYVAPEGCYRLTLPS
jgi:hypothetical protein